MNWILILAIIVTIIITSVIIIDWCMSHYQNRLSHLMEKLFSVDILWERPIFHLIHSTKQAMILI
jgi:hypothetical protein